MSLTIHEYTEEDVIEIFILENYLDGDILKRLPQYVIDNCIGYIESENKLHIEYKKV